MSQENVHVVRQMYDALVTSGPEAAFEYLDANIEWLPPPDVPTAGTYRGIEEVRAQFTDWTGQFSDYGWEPQDFISAPGGRVLVIGQQHGKGLLSGADVEAEEFHVWTIRDGKATRVEMYRSREQALEAVGLSE